MCILPAFPILSLSLSNESEFDRTLLPGGQRSEVVLEQIRQGKRGKGHRGGVKREEV